MSKVCSNCNIENINEAKFCRKCGSSFIQAEKMEREEKEKLQIEEIAKKQRKKVREEQEQLQKEEREKEEIKKLQQEAREERELKAREYRKAKKDKLEREKQETLNNLKSPSYIKHQEKKNNKTKKDFFLKGYIERYHILPIMMILTPFSWLIAGLPSTIVLVLLALYINYRLK